MVSRYASHGKLGEEVDITEFRPPNSPRAKGKGKETLSPEASYLDSHASPECTPEEEERRIREHLASWANKDRIQREQRRKYQSRKSTLRFISPPAVNTEELENIKEDFVKSIEDIGRRGSLLLRRRRTGVKVSGIEDNPESLDSIPLSNQLNTFSPSSSDLFISDETPRPTTPTTPRVSRFIENLPPSPRQSLEYEVTFRGMARNSDSSNTQTLYKDVVIINPTPDSPPYTNQREWKTIQEQGCRTSGGSSFSRSTSIDTFMTTTQTIPTQNEPIPDRYEKTNMSFMDWIFCGCFGSESDLERPVKRGQVDAYYQDGRTNPNE